MRLSDIRKYTNARLLGKVNPREIKALAIDSRKITDAAACLFIALKSNFRNGHRFIGNAYAKGIRCFLVSEKINIEEYPEATFLKVPQTLSALQKIAAAHRKKFKLPVIGLTGSNGKTIIKEWLFQLLAESFNVVRNPKSYNSQIGVPLSVWDIKPENNLGLFEAGISQPNEMEKLADIILPTIGLFTNIGDAHSEGFESQSQKIREKLKLFAGVEKLFYCRDHAAIHDEISFFQKQQREAGKRVFNTYSWSLKEPSTLQVKNINKTKGNSHIDGRFQGRKVGISIPFQDKAAIENALHCWLILLSLDLPDEIIGKRFLKLHPVAMRLETVHGIHNTILINDTYNSDLTSLKIALDVLVKQHLPKTIILSDLEQIGQSDEKCYQKIADWLQQKKINRLIGIGPVISRHKGFFRHQKELQSLFFETTKAFLKQFSKFSFSNEAILIKGARSFKFEQLTRLLEQMVHQTILEIDLSAVKNNLKVYKSLLPKSTKLMAMVKAFAYGNGSFEMAQTIQEAGADYLAVAYVDEGVRLRQADIQLPIMVMNPETNAYNRMISQHLEPEIFSLETLFRFQKTVKQFNQNKYPVHLMLDTGMHRLGFMPQDVEDLKQTLKNNPYLRVVSIFSHLSASGVKEFDSFTQQQIELFQKMADNISKVLPQKPFYHILNSTGIVRHKKYHFDMVRLGLGLYGIDMTGIIQNQLMTIGTLKTNIAQIRSLKQGAYVGYDLKGKISRNSKIATVNIGYADGYPRRLQGEGYMLVKGKKAPLVGAVCMDMCMLDVTDIPDVKTGDEVIVFGKNPHLSDMAKWADTIPYEIMTGISIRVNRTYMEE